MTTVRVATTNQGKLREFRQLLEPLGFEVHGIEDLPDLHVIEDGATFSDNALKKARAVFAATGEATVADDSGLVVDALEGAPGVHSARYAGITGSEKDKKNREKLLEAMREVPVAQRSARFVCALAYIEPNAEPKLFTGSLEGRISRRERGHNGFGYDPVFVIPELDKTAAEVSAEQKNARSHRGEAIRKLVTFLTARANQ